MSDEPASGVLGPAPVEVILAAAEALDPGSAAHLRAVPGPYDQHAVVSDDETDIAWADELAQALSREHPGRFHAFAVHPDFYWLTVVEHGVVLVSDEGAVDAIARAAGLSLDGRA